MGQHDHLIVSWAVGVGKNLAKATNKKGPWSQVCAMLSKTTRTAERYSVYMKMSRDEQLRLKSTNGWISGAQCDGNWRNLRSVRPRDLMTLDLDYPNPEFWALHESGLHWSSQFENIAVTTRSHGEGHERYRMVLPMARQVSPDEYSPLVRIVSFLFDSETQPMRQVDVVSQRRAQMMFLPTTSRDGIFLAHRNEGRLLDPDELFDWYAANHGDWKDLSKLPLYAGEETLRKHADKAEDPWLKPGMIGNWCRAWPIEDLIAEFLSDVYIPGDSGSGKPRYTYTGGSASNGAVVEDDGRFLYSHHGTDPVGEQLVNAWDLLRIHKFGKLDDDISTDTPIGKRPSTKAMQDFIKDDKRYMDKVVESRYDLGAMFGDSDLAEEPSEYTEEDIQSDIDDLVGGENESGAASAAHDQPPSGDDEPVKRKRPRNPREKDWFGQELEIDQNGNIKSTIHNVAAIIYNDARLYGSIRYDLFTRTTRLFHDIKSKTENVPDLKVKDPVHGDRWQEVMHITIRAILATPNGPGKVGYGLGAVAERDIAGAVLMAAMRNAYHPVKEYVEATEWDGERRIDRLFIDYLGCPDTPYHRETARMVMVASIARIYEPGHKFDFAPVLQGPQGIRKSSFIEVLYSYRWFGEIACKLNDTQRIAETIGGKWGMEFPELAAFYKSDHNDAKQFMSAREDTVRMAYAREPTEFPRQTVFWGSTNDKTYLKDPTGNRRWWPIICEPILIDTDTLKANRAQLWAEALHEYRQLRIEMPESDFYDLPLILSSEAKAEAEALQDAARTHELPEHWCEIIAQWADRPVTLSTFARQYQQDGKFKGPNDADPDTVWVKRVIFRTSDAATFALQQDWPMAHGQMVMNLNKAIAMLPGWENQPEPHGVRRWGTSPSRWKHRTGASQKDLSRGYVFVDPPEDIEEIRETEFTEGDIPPESDPLI